MDNSVTGNMDMFDSAYPRWVHDGVRHGCEPGLSATLPCTRLPIVPRYCWPPKYGGCRLVAIIPQRMWTNGKT